MLFQPQAIAANSLALESGSLGTAAQYQRPRYKFEQIAAKYLLEYEEKLSILTEATLLQAIMPFIGHLNLEQIHDDTLRSFIKARSKAGRTRR